MSFRAPDLLDEYEGKYNSRTDIWAFGCLAYELCTKEKAFLSDWATLNYANTPNPGPKVIFDLEGNIANANAIEVARQLSAECGRCLTVAWERRPSASELLKMMKGWQVKLKGDERLRDENLRGGIAGLIL